MSTRKNSLAADLYQRSTIKARHRHRFEFNPQYQQQLTAAGLRVSGVCPQNKLAEIIEDPNLDYFIGCQFHPEFTSRPTRPDPLFISFLEAAWRASPRVYHQ